MAKHLHVAVEWWGGVFYDGRPETLFALLLAEIFRWGLTQTLQMIEKGECLRQELLLVITGELLFLAAVQNSQGSLTCLACVGAYICGREQKPMGGVARHSSPTRNTKYTNITPSHSPALPG
jgi:hypothetical protein